MSIRKRAESTPLHLLQQLTAILLEHLEQACTQAHADAEKTLSRLDKKRSKVEAKQSKQRARVVSATAEGKRKARAKARAKVSLLEGALVKLQTRTDDTRRYIRDLKHDIQLSLTLVQGVGKVHEAAGTALQQRNVNGVNALGPSMDTLPNANRPPAVTRVAKKAATLRAIANAVVAEPVVTVINVKAQKLAPSEVAPLAAGVAHATGAPEPGELLHTQTAAQTQ